MDRSLLVEESEFQMKTLASIEIKGGPGNQLFQAAFAINIGLKHNTPIRLQSARAASSIFLQSLGFPLNRSVYPWWDQAHQRFRFAECRNSGPRTTIERPELSYQFKEPIFTRKSENHYDGDWQSPLHFKDIHVEFKLHVTKWFERLIGIVPTGSIAHFRRGDYLNPDFAGIYEILGENYYRRAFNAANVQKKEMKFLIELKADFYREEALVELFANYGSSLHSGGTQLQDMALLMGAQKLIIANSTFSWWGAFLSQADQIIAPRQWFTKEFEKIQPTNDLFPQHWICI